MALQTLGTDATTSLNALSAWAASLSDADIALISEGIANDAAFASILAGWSAGPTAVIGTGSTHTNTTLDSLVRVSGAALAQVAVGDLALAADIPPGTFVTAKASTTSVTLSQAATGTNAAQSVAFVRPTRGPGLGRNASLVIPNRGILKVLPGDIVGVDPITGWPILVSAAALSTAGSVWNIT